MRKNLLSPYCIKEFPNDSVKRVVWLYGAVSRNSSASTQSLVDIALRAIKTGGELGQAIVLKIAVAQLDIVRLGSIWQGRYSTDKNWSNYKNEHFKFDLMNTTVESVNYSSPNLNDTRYNRLLLHKYPMSVPDKNGYWHRFTHSQLTKLRFINAITVLIPALEMLTSTYTPKHQKIRSDLLSRSIDDVLLKQIYLDKSMGNRKGVYHLSLQEMKHKSNIIFIAYLLCNSVTKARVSKIWGSIATDLRQYSGETDLYKHPIVLPYHPNSLKIDVEGVWLDRSSFFVLRIMKVSLPVEHEINVQIDENVNLVSTNPEIDQDIIYMRSQNVIPGNLPITCESDPGATSGIAYIKSEIDFFPEEPLINILNSVTESENNAKRLFNDPNDLSYFSSGDLSYSSDADDIAKLKQSELEQESSTKTIDKSQIIAIVNAALVEILIEDGSSIESLMYIDGKANQYPEYTLALFPEDFFGAPGIGKWSAYDYQSEKNPSNKVYYKTTPRKLLLVQITLKNINHCIYLLEIERRPSESGFCGLIFNISEKILSEERLIKLLKVISKNKGKFRKRDNNQLVNLELPVLIHHVYEHSMIEKKTGKEKMERVIRKAEENFFSN